MITSIITAILAGILIYAVANLGEQICVFIQKTEEKNIKKVILIEVIRVVILITLLYFWVKLIVL